MQNVLLKDVHGLPGLMESIVPQKLVVKCNQIVNYVIMMILVRFVKKIIHYSKENVFLVVHKVNI